MEIEFLALLITWLILCFVVASIANSKGRDSISFFLLAFFLSPLVGFIVLAVLGDSEDKLYQRTLETEIAKQSIRAEFHQSQQNNILSDSGSHADRLDSLEKLGRLLKDQVITQDEFDIEKKKLLGSSGLNGPNTLNVTAEQHDLREDIRRLRKMIVEVSNNTFKGFDEDIPKLMRKLILDRDDALRILREYQHLFHRNLIEDLKATSSSYSIIEQYLLPLINLEIIQAKWPHSLKDNKV